MTGAERIKTNSTKTPRKPIPPMGIYTSSMPATHDHLYQPSNCPKKFFFVRLEPLNPKFKLKAQNFIFSYTENSDDIHPTSVFDNTSFVIRRIIDLGPMIPKSLYCEMGSQVFLDFSLCSMPITAVRTEKLTIFLDEKLKKDETKTFEEKVLYLNINQWDPSLIGRYLLQDILKDSTNIYPYHYGKKCHGKDCEELLSKRTCFGLKHRNITFCKAAICEGCHRNCTKCRMPFHKGGDCGKQCETCFRDLCSMCFLGLEELQSRERKEKWEEKGSCVQCLEEVDLFFA